MSRLTHLEPNRFSNEASGMLEFMSRKIVFDGDLCINTNFSFPPKLVTNNAEDYDLTYGSEEDKDFKPFN